MTDAALYQAGEAAYITGVSPETQREWRGRGFLPSTPGKHARFTVRDLCRLRMLRALIEAGIPIGTAVEQIADQFLDSLQAEVIACAAPDFSSGMLAVIAHKNGHHYPYIFWSLSEFAMIESQHEAASFETLTVVHLSILARDMVTKGILNHPGLRERD